MKITHVHRRKWRRCRKAEEERLSFPIAFRASVPVSAFLKGDRIQAVILLRANRVWWGFSRGLRQVSAGRVLGFVSVIRAPGAPGVGGERGGPVTDPSPYALGGFRLGSRRRLWPGEGPRQARAWWPPGVRTRAGPGGGLLKRGPAAGGVQMEAGRTPGVFLGDH